MMPSSPFATATAPITATDDELRAALADAVIPPLLPAIAYATGDLSLLHDDLLPDALLLSMPGSGLDDAALERARQLALDALARWRDAGCPAAPPPGDADLLRILEHVVGGGGETDMGPYLPLLEEELAYRGEDRRAPGFAADEVAPDRRLEVAVIGAGMSGLLAAHRLKQAGIGVTVLEKDADVGGTWLENSYPGCRVDNPNHNYSYAFAQRHDWPLHFSTHDVLLDYFQRCADAFELRPHIRFRTEVVSATWSDADERWTVVTRGPDGAESTMEVDAVVSAVGQLNRPRYPTEIDGYGSFEGTTFHSARWDHEAELAGQRVAVIGTGCSAVQFIPEIAPTTGHLLVFQRTPPWLGPTPDYHQPVEPGLQWLYRHVPSYSELHRFFIFWIMGDGALAGVRVDPDYPPRRNAVSAVNDMGRMVMELHLQTELADRPDLLAACTPDYPVGAKRIVRDDGSWTDTLKRDDVTLVTDPIAAITPTGIRMVDGTEHEVDVLIYGTGFQASAFLTPMRVTGRGGADLHEQWDGDARAYLGVAVPGFPNLFCLYGPNTNIVVNGSIIYFSECGVRYLLGCLELLLRGGHRSIEVRKDVHDEFNEQVDAENRRMAWGWSDVNSWYKNRHGRVAQNWPFTLLEYWQRTLAPDPDDFQLS